jgi:hypothetical protein
MVPMIPGRMRSSNLSVVVDLVVRVVCAGCACVVWACVFVYEQTLQLYPDERLSKKKKNSHHMIELAYRSVKDLYCNCAAV